MATTGTFTYNLNLEEILNEAFELVGGEITNGADLKKARRALALLLIDMQNKGHPLAELENKTFTVTSATPSYTLSAGTIDVLDMVVVRSSVATPVERVPLFQYHKIPTKTQKGLPSQYAVDRDRSAITVHLYQTPENSTDVIDYWCLTEIEDIGTNYGNNLDLNKRYLPAIIYGLAYYMALKKNSDTDVGLQDIMAKRVELKGLYDTALMDANIEDRERAPLKLKPFNYFR